ncbi:uncharacterized protein LOC130134864 [Syzygium oleosum]|uniref:uncharacterized protein LOC130134864 n=1 Tax=Syzygium oleosum TaxID=219896 RepID=UPI0024BBB127|nr:uncharacterized protein LOC130134864 [Syzygium oleosum]
MERSTPVRKPHTSTSDLLTWSETPPPHDSVAPGSASSRSNARSHQEVLFCLQVERNHRKHHDRAPDVVVTEARDRVKEFYMFEIIGIDGGASKSCRRCFTDATSSSDSLVM